MAICLAFFPPKKEFTPYLKWYVEKHRHPGLKMDNVTKWPIHVRPFESGYINELIVFVLKMFWFKLQCYFPSKKFLVSDSESLFGIVSYSSNYSFIPNRAYRVGHIYILLSPCILEKKILHIHSLIELMQCIKLA